MRAIYRNFVAFFVLSIAVRSICARYAGPTFGRPEYWNQQRDYPDYIPPTSLNGISSEVSRASHLFGNLEPQNSDLLGVLDRFNGDYNGRIPSPRGFNQVPANTHASDFNQREHQRNNFVPEERSATEQGTEIGTNSRVAPDTSSVTNSTVVKEDHKHGFNGKNHNLKILYPNSMSRWLSGDVQKVHLCIRRMERLPELMNIAVHQDLPGFWRSKLKWHTRMRKSMLQPSSTPKDRKSPSKCRLYEFELDLSGMPVVDGKYYVRVTRSGTFGQMTLAKSSSFKMFRIGAQDNVPVSLQTVEMVNVPEGSMNENDCSNIYYEIYLTRPTEGFDLKIEILDEETGRSKIAKNRDGKKLLFDKDRVAGKTVLRGHLRVPYDGSDEYLVQVSGKKRWKWHKIFRSEPFKCTDRFVGLI